MDKKKCEASYKNLKKCEFLNFPKFVSLCVKKLLSLGAFFLSNFLKINTNQKNLYVNIRQWKNYQRILINASIQFKSRTAKCSDM